MGGWCIVCPSLGDRGLMGEVRARGGGRRFSVEELAMKGPGVYWSLHCAGMMGTGGVWTG